MNEKITPEEARAGETSNHMRWVLIGSVGLAVVALILVFAI
tara:strand:+ start:454 stop:576 length:123 start_codon:yes stop_codon:yes gene_type:complete